MCVHVCTCIHRIFAERAGAVTSTRLALSFHSASISDGICRNSTKYCNADEIVVATNFWMHRINRSISMVILIEVRAIISMSLILWYNFVKCHSPTSISSADLFYFHWMTLTSSQIDTFYISTVFHRLIANKIQSSENFIFQMWLPSPCYLSGKSRSQSR